ncbi:hypothetical protein SCALM49S_01291 [Streptomyces californicus]
MLREAPGPYPALTRSFSTLVSDLLALDAELSEHLVRPGTLEAYDTELLRDLADARLSNADLRKIPETAEARRSLLGLTERYRAAKRARDLLDFGDQIALSAELALTRPEVGRDPAGRVPRRPPRRVPGHVGRPAPAALGPVRRRQWQRRGRRRGHRGRRRQWRQRRRGRR